jgi:undecaprenyl-diphosphatase
MHMNIFQAILYGIIQGITEFLPVSSTAHLTLLPWIAGWEDPGLAFDVALHIGTAAAVILFFIKDWLRIIKAGFSSPHSKDGKLFWLVVLATIPGGIAGVILDRYMSDIRNPLLIGIMLIIMGIFLYVADKLGKNETTLENMTSKKSLAVGLSQILAVIPGVSRSGITMTVGRFAGITRESAAKFTFLMSAPIILADALYHAKDMVSSQIDALPFIVAILTSAIVGALSIKFLLNYLKSKGFAAFSIYRFAFGAFIILLFVIRGGSF